MAELNPLPRPSLNEKLVDLYRTVSTTQRTSANGLTIRSHLQNVPVGKQAWGLSKFAGGAALTNAINGTSWRFFNAGNDYHSVNFRRLGRVPGFTQAAFDYARAAYKHDNTAYGSSFR